MAQVDGAYSGRCRVFMNILSIFTVGLATATTACAGGQMPHTVDVCLMGATIAPTKTDGSPWQPLGSNRTEQQDQEWKGLLKTGLKYVGAAVPEAALATEVAAVLSPSVIGLFVRPRVYGRMRLAPQGAYSEEPGSAVEIASADDSISSFTPRFGDDVCFRDIPWHRDLRVSVKLVNHHSAFAEEVIATVEVPPSSLAATYAANGVCQVPVGHQDPNVALLLMRVTKGAGATQAH